MSGRDVNALRVQQLSLVNDVSDMTNFSIVDFVPRIVHFAGMDCLVDTVLVVQFVLVPGDSIEQISQKF